MEQLIAKLHKNYRISEDDLCLLLDNMEERSFRKKDMIVREGERNTNFYIIKDGILRGYYYKDGADTTTWFATAGESAFSIWGYAGNEVSRINIEAVTDGSAYCLSRSGMEKLFGSSVRMANMGRRFMELQFLSVEDWMINGGSPKAKERYIKLIEDKPELLQSVPLKYIASYLYVTPQSLSRIRAQMIREKEK